MSSNQLKVNANKMQFMWLGSRQQVTKAQMQCQTLTLDGVEIGFCTELVCLDVVFDPELTFAVYIKRPAGKCFYYLRNICRTHQATCWNMFLPSEAAAHCSPDTDNGCSHDISPCFYNQSNELLQQFFLANASGVHLYPLQAVLHAAACVLTWKRKYDHMFATIRDQLHWLPVKHRIDHKLWTLIYKCLHNVAPVYLRDMCIPVSSKSGCSSLRSAAHVLTAIYGISAQEQKHLALLLLSCLDHPYGIHFLQLFVIHY